MYVMRPQGVSRSTRHCSAGTHRSGVRFWNFTASAPAKQAPSTSLRASSSEPLWLMPISAMTKTGSPSPTQRGPMRTRAAGAVMGTPLSYVPLSRAAAQVQDPLGELAEGAVAARMGTAQVRAGQHLGHRVGGGGGQPALVEPPQQGQVVQVVADEGDLVRPHARLLRHGLQVRRLVAYPLVEE